MPDHAFHGSNLIAGERAHEGTFTFTATDPTTGASLPGSFHEATETEIDRALTAAEEAFEANQSQSPEAWATLLETMADEIEALGETLVQRVAAETALGEGRVRGERGRTTNQLRMFAHLVREGSWVDARIDPAIPDREPVPRPDVRRMLVPLGPVAVFGASNFPLAFSVAGGDTASALAAGCPVVVKAHPAHPGTSELVAEALQRAVEACGFHQGTFSLVHGVQPAVSLMLVRHPFLQAVGFTGSLKAGRAIFDAAAARPVPIPVYAEMGSVNPVFLLPDALAERGTALADGLADSVTLGAGQFCTNPGLVFGVAGDALDGFMQAVASELRDTSAFTMLHGGICKAYRDGVEAVAGVAGVEVAARVEAEPEAAGAAVFTTDAEVFFSEPRLHEEVFGPSTLVVRCADLAEMELLAATLEGNLTATLHGTSADLASANRLIQVLRRRVGRLILNGFPTGVEVCPSMHHGGPYPATTDVRSTSVGTAAIYRFARPICYQDFPQEALPATLRDQNERGIWRLINGEQTRADVTT
ncbi:MAG TPA: aldehyde dehydrogenase (NADP(+)) [Rhodothermales bacterium]|nr:aldehyde dehydrogenase (NADP(+)) [Rhodothermales bacterium]